MSHRACLPIESVNEMSDTDDFTRLNHHCDKNNLGDPLDALRYQQVHGNNVYVNMKISVYYIYYYLLKRPICVIFTNICEIYQYA